MATTELIEKKAEFSAGSYSGGYTRPLLINSFVGHLAQKDFG